MLTLIVGLVLLLGIHALPMNADLRRGLIGRFGAGPYKIAFSIASLVGLALVIYGYHKLQVNPGKNPQLWALPTAARHVALLLMVPALILLVAAYVPSHIGRWVRHPMSVGIVLWAVAHLLVNGDLGSLVLFGSLLAYVVINPIFSGTAAAREQPASQPTLLHDLGVVIVGLMLYATFVVWAHEQLIGIPVMNV